MAYTMTDADSTFYNTKPNVSLPNIQKSTSTFNPLNSGTYNYQQGSAQGPLNYAQMNQAQQTGTAYIKPATTNIQSALNNGANNDTASASTQPGNSNESEYKSKLEESKTNLTNLKTDYDNTVKQRETDYNAILEAKRAAVRAAIDKEKVKFQQQIDEAPQTFQTQRDNVEVNRYQNLTNIRRSLANIGYNPDAYVTRQEQSDINVGAENQINQLDIAQKKVITDAQNAIRQLEAQGNIEDANAIAEISMQKMQALDNLKQAYMNNIQQENNTYMSNLKGLMDYERQVKNDQTEAEYKDSVLEKENNKNLLDYQTEMTKNQQASLKQIKEEFYKNYGFYPSDEQMTLINSYQDAASSPELYNLITQNQGNLKELENNLVNNGYDSEVVNAVKGARLMKILNQNLTQYASDYNLPPTWQNAVMKSAGDNMDAQNKINEPLYQQNYGILVNRIIASGLNPREVISELNNDPELPSRLGTMYPDFAKFIQGAVNDYETRADKKEQFDWNKYMDINNFNQRVSEFQDSSARGWASNQLGWANHNFGVEKFDYQKEQDMNKPLTDSDFYNNGYIPPTDMYKNAVTTARNYMKQSKENAGDWWKKAGSVERQQAAQGLATILSQSGLEATHRAKIYNDIISENGLTEYLR